MAGCINGKWKLPLGHFFVVGPRGDQKSAIVSHCVKQVSDTAAYVISLTFDATPSRIKKQHWERLNHFFQAMIQMLRIMMKFVRNCFGEKKLW